MTSKNKLMEALRLVQENVDPGEAEHILNTAFEQLMDTAEELKRLELSSHPELASLISGTPGQQGGVRGLANKVQRIAAEIYEEAAIFFDPEEGYSHYKPHDDLEE